MAHKALEEIIGRNIARYREVAGLTQATLAEKIGISTAFVSRVERGQKKMKVETLYATAKVLNVRDFPQLFVQHPRHSWQTSTSFWRASPMSIWRESRE